MNEPTSTAEMLANEIAANLMGMQRNRALAPTRVSSPEVWSGESNADIEIELATGERFTIRVLAR